MYGVADSIYALIHPFKEPADYGYLDSSDVVHSAAIDIGATAFGDFDVWHFTLAGVRTISTVPERQEEHHKIVRKHYV